MRRFGDFRRGGHPQVSYLKLLAKERKLGGNSRSSGPTQSAGNLTRLGTGERKARKFLRVFIRRGPDGNAEVIGALLPHGRARECHPVKIPRLVLRKSLRLMPDSVGEDVLLNPRKRPTGNYFRINWSKTTLSAGLPR